MQPIPVISLAGPGGSGKDFVAKWLNNNTRWVFKHSTSWHCAKYVRSRLEAMGHNYGDLNECYLDRVNHRLYWDRFIREYNRNDPARMYREMKMDWQTILQRCCTFEEVETLRRLKIVDLFIWIERQGVPSDPTQYFGAAQCDITILNPRTAQGSNIDGPTLEERLRRFASSCGALSDS